MPYLATGALMTPAAVLAIALPAWAQRGPISVPNPMATHTVFIILITARLPGLGREFFDPADERTRRREEGA